MARSTSPRPPISLMDIFIGSGRTIRRPTGPPGTHLPRRTELVQVRPSASARKSSGDSKPAVAVKSSSNKENAASGSTSNSKQEEVPSGSKSNSKKEVAPAPAPAPSGSKSNSKKDDSKPSSSKEDVKPSSNKDDSRPSSLKSDSKHNSKKDVSKPKSKPTSAKATSEEKAADDKKADTKKSDGKKPEEPQASGSKPQGNAQQSSDLIVFTAEDDAKILLMKNDGIDAKVIGAEIGKGKKQVNKRFDQTKPKDWKPQNGRKDAVAVIEMKKPSEKQLSKVVDKSDKKAVESRNKSSPVEKMGKPEETPTAVLLAGKVQHQHDVRLSHAHHHDHHVHVHDSHESRPRHHSHSHDRPRHRSHTLQDPADSGYASNPHSHKPDRAHKSYRPRPAASIAASSKTAFTIKTMPSLSEDDLFSFGELQALSELIGKDMEGLWHRVSAAFFGMTGRRISAEDIKDKFSDLEIE